TRNAMITVERAGGRQRTALEIGALVVALVGAVVVGQTTARHLAGRVQDVGVLQAMGATPGDRLAAAMWSIAPALGGGVVLGGVLAVAMSPLLPFGVPRRTDPSVGFHVDVVVILLGAVIGLAAVTVVAGVVARRWAADRPRGATEPSTALISRLDAVL